MSYWSFSATRADALLGSRRACEGGRRPPLSSGVRGRRRLTVGSPAALVVSRERSGGLGRVRRAEQLARTRTRARGVATEGGRRGRPRRVGGIDGGVWCPSSSGGSGRTGASRWGLAGRVPEEEQMAPPRRTPSTSTAVASPGIFPLLADGVAPGSSPFLSRNPPSTRATS